VYQPILERLASLRENAFGGEGGFMRVVAERVYGVPPAQVIGSRTGRGKRMSLGVLMALAAIAGGERAAAAQSTGAPATAAKAGPRVVVAETTSITARVDAVDVRKRLVTVTGPGGKTVTLRVGPEVKDLDQVKPGEQLVVRYFESLALFVRKGGEPPTATEGIPVQVVPDKRKKPAPVAVDTVEFRGTVEAIDDAKRRVTIKGPEGKTRTIKVDPSVKGLTQVKQGDQVVVRYTEAIVFSVRKP
jgi:hypothetical protein